LNEKSFNILVESFNAFILIKTYIKRFEQYKFIISKTLSK